MTMHALALPVRLALLASVLLSVGCHADDNDPKGQAEELADPVRREHAVGRLHSIFSTRLVEAKGDRSAASIKEFCDQTAELMVKAYLDYPEDTQNGLKLLSLMAEMRDARTLPALLKALEWKAEVTEDHAVTAARTMTEIDIPDGQRGEVVDKICKALSRVDGARGVDNRMRKAFIEVLGKLKDKRATDTLIEVAMRQDESQNFLFNILATQQLVKIGDEKAIPALIKGLYLFAPDNPAMRMNDVAASALVAIGRPALEPMLKVLRGEDDSANKVVDAYIDTVRKKDPEAAAAMNPRALISAEATFTLGKLGFRDALDPLIEESQAKDDTRKFGAAIALVSLQREKGDTERIVETLLQVYNDIKKQMRPQMLVAMRHLYADQLVDFFYETAKAPETELPPIRLYAFAGGALLANKAEGAKFSALLDEEELFKAQLEEYRPALKAAAECDENVECWVGKLKDKDKVVLRKASSTLARYGRGNDKAIAGLIELFGHDDLEVRNEALAAVDAIAVKGSKAAVEKLDELEAKEGGRSIWNNFKREAEPARARLLQRAGG